jgi:hypothetical protein
MYAASVTVFDRMLANLEGILAKATTWSEARKIDQGVLLGLRLAPDMLPLTKQIQIATDHAKGCSARLAGIESPKFEDNEVDLAQLLARLAKTRAFLGTLKPEQFVGAEQRDVHLKFGPTYEVKFKGLDYLLNFATPNFYFHATAAYAILRHNGLEIGKRDFVG